MDALEYKVFDIFVMLIDFIQEGAQIIQSGDGQVCMFQSVPFNCGDGNQIIGVKGFLVPSRAVTSTAGGGAPTPLNFEMPENKVEDVENKTVSFPLITKMINDLKELHNTTHRFKMGQSTTQLATVEITCVNPKQYHRILKRRQERAKLVATGRIPKQRSVSHFIEVVNPLKIFLEQG